MKQIIKIKAKLLNTEKNKTNSIIIIFFGTPEWDGETLDLITFY